MVNPDLLNGILEFIGSLTIWANVRKLRQDKIVKGTHWEMMFFFASWAAFNLFYYPHLNQMWSLAGATSMFVAEVVWVVLASYYAFRGTEQEMDLTMPPQEYFDIETPRLVRVEELIENLVIDLPERDRSLKNPYSPASIELLQRKFGGDNVQV